MSELAVENKQVVVPGQVLATGMDYLPGVGAYRSGDAIRANRIGLVSVDGRAIKLIPLAGRYNPKEGDIIIAKVIDIAMSGWRLDTNSAFSAMLPLKDASEEYIEKGADLTKLINFGEHVLCRISMVTTQKLIDLTLRGPGLRKLTGGQIIKVKPARVPRVIGKQGSMVSQVKDATGCNIIVGQNGVIWVSGSPQGEIIAVEAIKKIESMVHVPGLTDLMGAWLAKRVEGLELPKAEPIEDAPRHQQTRRDFGGDRRGGNNRYGGDRRNGGGRDRRSGDGRRDGGRPFSGGSRRPQGGGSDE